MKIVSRPELFTVVAGYDLLAAMEAETDAVVQNRNGYRDSEQVCELQQRQARRGIVGVEIVASNYGASVRYDSGLQNFGLLAGSRSGQLDGTLEDAERFAREWVSHDPERRYAWRRTPRPVAKVEA
ncbi:hypothetical protein ACHMW4_04255 [Mesorhizobium sp. UC22_110]|uniref:hypothetical protein n=1 Tax=unclassified Mesorhizobium TaxID=325217 RepID=UPI00366F6334